MTRAQTQQALRQLPVKWALALLAIIVVYAVAQPALNSRLGWNLPSLARLVGEPEPKQPQAKNSAAKNSEPKKSVADDAGKQGKSQKDSLEQAASELRSDAETEAARNKASADSPTLTASQEPASKPEPKSSSDATSDSTRATAKKPLTESNTKAAADSKLLYGILKETGRDRYISVEGLQYNPGSEEGHRLKHLERHLKDMPDRPGKHGVFKGEMKDALKQIDDAYARGKRGAKGVRKSQEDNRTVYEVPFSEPIGFIGGREGNQKGKPPAKRLRLVVEGNKFITAFPF